ncbi:MAG: hypothetical protein E5V75_22580 [Mesorhizobium sp.]|nr:MAG: hypothetical protein E5V75_22580 [Mesorhizobium sp.]
MIRKAIAWTVFIIGAATAMIYGLAGLVAWADAQHVCPYGNQCSDAHTTIWFGAIVVLASSVVCAIALRTILRSRR